MKKYNFRKLQFLLITILGLSIILTSCKEDEPAPGPESQLANKEWKTEGVYVGGTKTISPNVRLEFTTTNLLNTLTVNGQLVPGTWNLSADGQSITVTYPEFSVASGSFGGAETQTFVISRLTDSELWFTVSGSEEVNFLGFLTLDSNSEYRMNLDGAVNTVTSTELTGSTWTGDDGTEDTGVFTRPSTSDAFTWNRNTGLTFKFGTTLGFNHVTINGIPAPGSWELNEAKDKLTILYPSFTNSEDATEEKGGTVIFDVVKLESGELWLQTSNAITLGVVSLAADNQLRMIPQ